MRIPGCAFLVCLTGTAIVSCGAGHEGQEAISEERTKEAFAVSTQSAGPSFTLFESGQVRPLALSPDGSRLFAINTPDNRLEIFDLHHGSGGLRHRASIPAGLEPVAVAARSKHEVWVVNHLSDSVSVIDVRDPAKGRVVRTLLVGDEPRDIVFAGPQRERAFITTAHRGQNSPIDPQLTTPGVGRADVWVFDANDLGASLGGTPVTILTLFSDTPRALAVTPDGARVYAAAFNSGNQTTTINQRFVLEGAGLPPPTTNFQGIPQPPVGLIVKYNGAHWVDELGRDWDDQVKFALPDKDVFVIDATANPPAQLAGAAGYFQGVGTTLFNMIVNPANGKVYVTNTEARNEARFEGAGIFAGHSVRGHLHESRISVLGAGGVAPRHLNKHIDYGACCAPIPSTENQRSLAIPLGMAITGDGSTLYVAAFGSSKIGVFDTAQLEGDTFVPSAADHITVSGGGPTGMVLDEREDRLYVLTRFDDSISVIDLQTKTETAHVPMFNPEPESVVAGRRFLYDASFSSSHGDSACASCHVFGDLDGLAWDLGNPDGTVQLNPGPTFVDPLLFGDFPDFHPLKGPMATQSLRGLANHGPMHWRGDRTGGHDAQSAQPDSGTFDEEAAFKKFIVTFEDLLGRAEPIPDEDMQALTDFALQITYPPNPIRALDGSLTPEQQMGKSFFFSSVYTPLPTVPFCSTCHPIDPTFNAEHGVAVPGVFGTNAEYTGDGQGQLMKTPHFRNAYQKVGMFGFPEHPDFNPIDNGFMGDQVRGFGFVHDGSNDSIFRFISNLGFSVTNPFFPEPIPTAFPDGAAGDPLRRAVESFILAFDSNMAPIVGQQITLTSGLAAEVGPRLDLLIARADAGECDLVARGRLSHRELGFLYRGDGTFRGNRADAPPIPDAVLRQLVLATRQELTYTCAPPGSGERIGLDRDGDGFLDGDEEDHHTSPADPSSHP